MAGSLIINGKIIAAVITNPTGEIKDLAASAWKECPNCKYHIYNGDVSSQWPRLPVGVKFEPSDQELLIHLEGQVGREASHVLINEFIPTIEEKEGICYTHPENLPGIKMDGRSCYFFHKISKAYDVGSRKRRKISNSTDTDCDEQMTWHKTGKSSAILDNGVIKGWKKILVLHKRYKGKKVKTNWTMHQCHLGPEEGEKHGELVVSRVFWQVKSNTGKSQIHVPAEEFGSSAVKIDPTTPKSVLSGSPFETEQNQDEEEPGSSAVQLKADAEEIAGSSQSIDYDVLLDLDKHLLPYDDISDARHEKPLPSDFHGIDVLAFSDPDCTYLQMPLDFPTQADSFDC